MATQFELWLNGCKMNNSIIHCLEGSGDTALYQTKEQYLYKYNYYYTTPIYHVWIKGEWIVAMPNYLEAYTIYDNRIKELSNQEAEE